MKFIAHSPSCLKWCLTILVLSGLRYGSAQTVTLNFTKVHLETAIKSIQDQTGYGFVYTRKQMAGTSPVTVILKDASIRTALDICLKDQPLIYHIEDRYVVLKDKNVSSDVDLVDVHGIITDEAGNAVAGATIQSGDRMTVSSDDGSFRLRSIAPGSAITVTSIGHKSMTLDASEKMNITLNYQVKVLDETLVVAYGKVTKRFNTGSVNKVSKEDIQRQPTGNVLTALQGTVPGLVVSQPSGIPGAAVSLQIRGRTSINSNINNDPLIIIDGVPFAPNNTSISQVSSALGTGGLSPFSLINPADIESIEILKDADATAIYGSRGANGVILISTRKGKAGKTKLTLNAWTGFSRATRSPSFLSTREYVALRKEAFANDGITPNATVGSPGYAPDLMIWDTTRYTDLRKMLTGGTARSTDLQLTLSGGNESTQFSLGSGYFHQTTVFPGSLAENRGSLHFDLSHRPIEKKYSVSFKAGYVSSGNTINVSDLSALLRLPPNIPALYTADGKLNWESGGVVFDNPLASSLKKYRAASSNLITNLRIGYRFHKSISFTTSLGYNILTVNDHSTNPIAAQNPATAPLGSASFGSMTARSLIAEPQLDYSARVGKLKLIALAGATLQQNVTDVTSFNGNGYTSDLQLGSLKAASAVTVIRDDRSDYRYAAAFGRINLRYADKYILNITGRRDGSSRFGPGKRFANFGAVGAAWLFSSEAIVRRAVPVLSSGKLRASYGTTGNDKIGDYAFLNTFSATGQSYGGTGGITPTSLFNPDYAWEMNRKFEAVIETGWWKDRLLLSVAFYRNLCSNQLINFSLPAQTGGSGIIANFPAVVENKGWEIESSAVLAHSKNFSWTAGFNLTIPSTKLLSYPNFESSVYNSTLVVGQPLNIAAGYRSAGVNPSTGLFEYLDKEGKITSTPVSADRVKDLVKLDPRFYGGLSTNMKVRHFEIDVLFEFRSIEGRNYIGNIYGGSLYPGMMFNLPRAVLTRWHKPGDVTEIQKATTRPGTAAYTAANFIRLTGAENTYSDASYVRVKNVSLAYVFAESLLKKAKIEQAKVYIRAQNLFTLTKFKGGDPEGQDIFRMPPLRTIAAGLQLTF